MKTAMNVWAAAMLAVLMNPVAHAAEPAAGSLWTEPNTGIEFVYIPAGCFNMGGSEGDKDEVPVHRICVKAFYLGKTEVTQAQWRKISGKSPSKFSGDSNPVEQVSWNDIKENLEEFNYQTHGKYRFPTEAEWEYACRAGGEHDKYCGTGSVDKLAWYDNGSDRTSTHPVGQKRPNAWGLYDMSGNVWERTEDCYHDSFSNAPADGSAWKGENGGQCELRVLRGGSWGDPQQRVRASKRERDDPTKQNEYCGFRLVRPLP